MTPFLIPGRRHLRRVATFAAPRLIAPSAALLRGAAGLLLVANLASAVSDEYALLLTVRMAGGAAAGVITWLVWADAMRHPTHMVGIAAAGPLAALIGAPLLAAVSEGGDRAMYLALAATAVVPVLLRVPDWEQTEPRRGVSRSRSNRVLLVALLVLTLGGAGLFVFEAVAARDLLGMSSVEASLAFSLNAAAGLVGARWSARHRRPGWFLVLAGAGAYVSVAGHHPFWFHAGMTLWGFAFWMGVPGVLKMIAARSLEPDERAGDAQAMMAFGRALGPFVGGGFVDAGAYESLAMISAGAIVLSGATVISVQEGRDRLVAAGAAR